MYLFSYFVGSSLELVFGILALLCLVVAIIIALVILLYYKKYFHGKFLFSVLFKLNNILQYFTETVNLDVIYKCNKSPVS